MKYKIKVKGGDWHLVNTLPSDTDLDSIESIQENQEHKPSEEMLNALLAMQELIDVVLPKFNWGASALDANAIRLLNDVPIRIRKAIAKARGEA
jgi:hypothetical protein